MKKDKYIYIEPYKMLFIHEDGGYYPLYYDCVKTENGYEGKTIKTNTILGNWLMYVKHSFKTPSKNSNKVIQGNLYLYQWYLSIQVIISVMEFKGDMWNIMACRQVGIICPSI